MGKRRKKDKTCKFGKDNIFEKYAIHYIDDSISEEERERYLSRQRYVYNGLCEKDIQDTNIEKLLDITLQELHNQETIKQVIGNKIGFVIAFLGILIGIIIEADILNELIEKVENIRTMPLVGSIAILILAAMLYIIISVFISIYNALKPKNWEELDLDDKDDETFKAAVDDKRISLIVLLESSVYALTQNRNTNREKALVLRKMTNQLILFVLLLLVTVVITI